jgi:hypothetical protein
MKIISRLAHGALCASFLSLAVVRADTPAGQIDFGTFEPSKSRGEFVEVNLKGPLLAMAAKFAGKEDPEVAKLVESLKSVRVNVVGIGDDNRAEVSKRLVELRGKLDAGGWDKVVNVQDKGSRVTVHLKTRGTESVEGIVVLVDDGGKEAVLVNVVGDVKPEQLEKLGARLGLEPLRQAGEAIGKEKK